MSARHWKRVTALVLVGMLVFAGGIPALGSALSVQNSNTQSLSTVANDGSGDPWVSLGTETIDDSTETTIEIDYQPGDEEVSNLALRLSGPQTSQSTGPNDYLFERATADDPGSFDGTLEQSGGTLSITFPKGTFGGGEIPLEASLVRDEPFEPLDTDAKRYSVASNVQLSNPEISPTTVKTDEPITVSATLTNTGDSPDSFVLTAHDEDGEVWNSKYLTLDAGEIRDVSFTTSQSYSTQAELSVSGSAPTTVTIESPIEVTETSVSPTTVSPGESVELTATVENTGSTSADRYLTFSFAGWHETDKVTLDAGETTTITKVTSTTRLGEHTPYVETTALQSVTVESDLTVTDVSLSASTIDIGDSVDVTTTLSNPTDQRVQESVEVAVHGVRKTVPVDIAPGETATKTLTLTPTEPGTQSVRVNDEWTDTDLTVDGVLEIVDESVSVTPRPAETGRPVTIEFTYRNPSDSGYTADRRVSISLAGGYTSEPVTLAPGETQDFSVTVTPERVDDDAPVRVDATTIATVATESPIVVDDVQYDHEVAVGETATVTATVTNTDEEDARTRTLSVFASTNDDNSVSARRTVEVDPGATTTVDLDLQMDTPGDYWVQLPDSRETGIAVLGDTTGTADLTFEIRETNSVSVRNEARFFASLTNTGDADGSKLLTLQRTEDGPIIESDVILAEPGEEAYGSVAMEFDSPGEKTIYLNGEPHTITVTEPYIRDSSVSVVEGTVPDRMPVLEGGYDRGYLNIEFRINERRASSYDLSRIGADKSTRFKVELTVRDFDPKTVIANGRDIEWSAETLSDGKTKLTLYISPVDQSYLEDTPDFGEWGETQRTAAFTIENRVQFRAYGDSPDSDRDYGWADGLALSTNAQQYSAPQYYETADGNRFDVRLAAPHFTEDGSLNTGHYTAHIPQSTLDDWGVESPSDLEAAYTGADDTTIDITDTGDGMTVRIDLHYSSGTVSVGEQGAVPATDEPSDGSNDDDSDTDDDDSDPDPEPGDSDDSDDEPADDPADEEQDSQSSGSAETTTESPGTETPTPTTTTETPESTTETATTTDESTTAAATTSDTTSATTDVTDTSTTTTTGPGFGVVAALVALASAFVLFRRRD